MPEIRGLDVILGPVFEQYGEGFASSSGPLSGSPLPISYWYPAWWGLSPWASPFWKVVAVDAS